MAWNTAGNVQLEVSASSINLDNATLESDVLLVRSDTLTILSDTRLVITEQLVNSSDVRLVYSDTKLALSDTRLIIAEQLVNSSDVRLIRSDTETILSDTKLIAGVADAFGTFDTVLSDAVQVGGRVWKDSPPVESSDGKLSRLAVDAWGRQIGATYDFATGATQVEDVAPALIQTLEATLLNAVTASGASAATNVKNYKDFTIHTYGTSVSDGATITLQASLDNSTYINIASDAIISTTGAPASVNGEITVENTKYAYLKANLAPYTDGTYSTKMIAGN